MTASTMIQNWIMELPPNSVFEVGDVQNACPIKSRGAIKTALSRLAQGEDPPIARATRGIYVRRNLKDTYPIDIHPQIADWLNWAIAVPGAGFAPPNAINAFGWSTQIPAKNNIVVVGRPPKPIDRTVRYFQRSNLHRRKLDTSEISLLEAVNGFDTYSEKSWKEAVEWADQRKYWVDPPDTIDTKGAYISELTLAYEVGGEKS